MKRDESRIGVFVPVALGLAVGVLVGGLAGKPYETSAQTTRGCTLPADEFALIYKVPTDTVPKFQLVAYSRAGRTIAEARKTDGKATLADKPLQVLESTALGWSSNPTCYVTHNGVTYSYPC